MTTFVGWFKPQATKRSPTCWEPLIESNSHAVCAYLLNEKVSGHQGQQLVRREGHGPDRPGHRGPPAVSSTGQAAVLAAFRPGEWLLPAQVSGRLFDRKDGFIDTSLVCATLGALARAGKLERRVVSPEGARVKRYEYALLEEGDTTP